MRLTNFIAGATNEQQAEDGRTYYLLERFFNILVLLDKEADKNLHDKACEMEVVLDDLKQLTEMTNVALEHLEKKHPGLKPEKVGDNVFLNAWRIGKELQKSEKAGAETFENLGIESAYHAGGLLRLPPS